MYMLYIHFLFTYICKCRSKIKIYKFTMFQNRLKMAIATKVKSILLFNMVAVEKSSERDDI